MPSRFQQVRIVSLRQTVRRAYPDSSRRQLRTLRDKARIGERIEFYPSHGRLAESGDFWHVAIRGRVIIPRPDNLRKKMLLGLLERALKADPAELRSEIFHERIRDFLMLGQRGRHVSIRIGDRVYPLKRSSDASGLFGGVIRIPCHELLLMELEQEPDGDPWIRWSANTAPPEQAANGRAMLMPTKGLTVISDIDDTVKVTHVGRRQELLANTFLKPFQAISGVAELYNRWRAAGVNFHYVSSSPWQLYHPLTRFFGEHDLPHGAFHLRPMQLQGASAVRLLVGRKSSKKKAVRLLMKWYPGRRFILIGDSAEKDPEIYGSAARRFPDQVSMICIRQLPEKRLKGKRLRHAFRHIPKERLRLFSDAAELSDIAPDSERGWVCD